MFLLGVLIPLKSTEPFAKTTFMNHDDDLETDTEGERRIPPVPNPSFIQLRSPLMPRQQPNDPIRWKLLNMDVIDAPYVTALDRTSPGFTSLVNVLDEPLKALEFNLQPVSQPE